jgi:hypothetical protein
MLWERMIPPLEQLSLPQLSVFSPNRAKRHFLDRPKTLLQLLERAAHWRPNPEAVAVWRMLEDAAALAEET